MLRIFSQYVSPKGLLLAGVEAIVITLSFLLAVRLRFWNNPDELAVYQASSDFALQVAVVAVTCLSCFYFNDLYRLNFDRRPLDHVLRVEQSLGAAVLLLSIFYWVFPQLLLSGGVFLIGMVFISLFTVLGRKLLELAWTKSAPLQRVAILGTGRLAQEVARAMTLRDDLAVRVEGFLGTSPLPGERVFGYPVLGSIDDLETVADKQGIGRIVVALEDRRGHLPTRELVTLRVRGVYIEDAASILSALNGRVSLQYVKPSWFVFSEGFRRSRWNDCLKRSIDLVFGLLGLFCSLPIMILVALAVRLESKGPVIYRQTRVGKSNAPFEIMKFRSMSVDAEKDGGAQWARVSDPRVTRIGAVLRKFRLDELPQFINVIRGDMSFVGPRPERPCFVEQFRKTIPYYDERHSVRPGITGWAQVRYPYGATVEDTINKLEYDLFYLKNMSFTFDLAIIFDTVRIVVGGRGAR